MQIAKQNLVPINTKLITPGKLGRPEEPENDKVRKALQRTVKRIMIMKRLQIIRQVNTVIENVCKTEMPEEETDEDAISCKKLVKILNLCHVYVPIMHCELGTNSTKLSLDPLDLLELGKSKQRYKEFVDLQCESLEAIVAGFGDAGNASTVSRFLSLLAKHCVAKNQYS